MNPVQLNRPTLAFIVDTWLGDDGEVSPSRWYHRALRLFVSDEWLDKRYGIQSWWERRFDSDISNDAH